MRTRAAALAALLVLPAAALGQGPPPPPPAAVAGPAAVAACPPDLSGRWSGCWVSDVKGHHGPLHAYFRRTADGCYRVTFCGRFWRVVPFVYSVNLAVTGVAGDTVFLSGSTVAGPVIGTFQYDAAATATQFEAHFVSKKDHGRFVLSRDCGCR